MQDTLLKSLISLKDNSLESKREWVESEFSDFLVKVST